MDANRKFIYDDFRISQEHSDESWTMPYSHYHAAYEIYVLEEGERAVTIDGAEYIAQAHDATLFPSNIPHKSRGGTPFKGICIHFTERYLDLYFTKAAKTQLMKCFAHKLIGLSGNAFKEIKRIADEYDPDSSGNFIRLAKILDIMNSGVKKNGAGNTPAPENEKKKFQLIIEYVSENYSHIKRVSDITELFNVSENYVFRVFRKHCGMTPKQYINRLRIRNACHRLENTPNSIKSIAFECGFDSYEYFLDVFKRTTGITPTEYRESNA